MKIQDFVHFYEEMMLHHRWGVPNINFAAKYIDSITDTRDGEIWSITLRDIATDDEIWAKIPDAWMVKNGNSINICIRDVMDDTFKTMQERADFLIELGKA